MSGVSTEAERTEWLKARWGGRKPLIPMTCSEAGQPSFVWQDNARESEAAFLAGLFLASILTGYAACEIYLADRLALVLRMIGKRVPESAAEWATWAVAADKETQGIPGLELIIRHFEKAGQWIELPVLDAVRRANKRKNEFAHFRPPMGRILSFEAGLVATPNGVAAAVSFERSQLVAPEYQEDAAREVLSALIDLRCAQVYGGLPGFPRPAHFPRQRA